MRKSQIISLVVLLVLVTAVIWIGSFTGSSTPAKPDTPESGIATEAAEATPEITDQEILDLPTGLYEWSGSSAEFERTAYDKMVECGAIFDFAGKSEKTVYLTFETGYSGGDADNQMNAILDALKETGVKATFLISAEYIESDSCTSVLKRIVNEGHALGSRGSVGTDMFNQSIDEYGRILDTIKTRVIQLVGDDNVKMKVFRPFKCKFSIRDLAIAKRAGFYTVFWTVNYAQENGLNGLKDSMTNNLKEGGIYNIPIYATAGKTNVLADALKAAQKKFDFALLV